MWEVAACRPSLLIALFREGDGVDGRVIVSLMALNKLQKAQIQLKCQQSHLRRIGAAVKCFLNSFILIHYAGAEQAKQ